MTRVKPFAYLNGMVAADDAPVMDNPARLYCPSCRAAGMMHCSDPGYCGNMRPMKPLPDAATTPPDAIEPAQPTKPPHQPRRGSKEAPKVSLDDSRGQMTLQDRRRPKARERTLPELNQRLIGRRTTLRPIPPEEDGKEQSWEWFMENLTKGLDGEPL
jgi:hypothetical protein